MPTSGMQMRRSPHCHRRHIGLKKIGIGFHQGVAQFGMGLSLYLTTGQFVIPNAKNHYAVVMINDSTFVLLC